MTTATVVAELLMSDHAINVELSAFEDGDYLVSLIKLKQMYLRELVTPSPSFWIIEPKNPARTDFGVSMVSYKRFKELHDLASKQRSFPIEEISLFKYQNTETGLAILDMAEFKKDQRFMIKDREFLSADVYMSN